MKKVYYAPALQVEETQVCNMMAVSLKISSETEVDGSEALSKENDGDWSIWEE